MAIAVVKDNNRLKQIAFFLMILFIPFVYSTGINFFTDEYYKGTVRGYEVLATDMIAFALLGAMIASDGIRNVVFFPRGSGFYVIYFGHVSH